MSPCVPTPCVAQQMKQLSGDNFSPTAPPPQKSDTKFGEKKTTQKRKERRYVDIIKERNKKAINSTKRCLGKWVLVKLQQGGKSNSE